MGNYYDNIGVWAIELYRLDADGNPLKDKEGKVIRYTAPHIDTFIDTESITTDDLEEVSNG
tara:strand:+ start:2316 stop:2498 length:183 start_codon:yes stop_codon:yes gene_type:complete